MKHLGKILLFIATLAIFQITYSGALGVEKMEVIDNTTMKVTLSENPNLEVGMIDAEVTILNDIQIATSILREDSTRQIEITLESALNPNTSYSLLTVLGTDGSIDFITPEAVEGYIATNITNMVEQNIESIEVLDNKTIIISYMQDLGVASYEYKLLAENEVLSIEKRDYELGELYISVVSPFKSEQNYILMFIDMQDVEGDYIEFDTGIYDFTSPMLDDSMMEEEASEEMEENMEELDILPVVELTEEEIPTDIDLDAAGEETSLEKTEATTEEVAMSADTTPDTGAQTWVLILATLLINSFYYFNRRKKVSMA